MAKEVNLDWSIVSEAFDSLRQLPLSQRETRLAEVCRNDAAVIAEVRALLAAHDESEGFLESPALASQSTGVFTALNRAMEGRRFGPYEICRLIGTGGMGEVYEGRRVDGEFEQRVAIKIIREGQQVLRDPSVEDRFRRERQILADLSHPNIARLLDGGTTPEGLPYLVMEFIDGLPLDEFADQNRLSQALRVELLRPICRAVSYAHSRGVYHRDIKPANILIAKDGTPKLLDFGIAKSRTTADMTATQIGTPEYASPEQLRGAPVTAATDIYSLGAVLRRLSAGAQPTGRLQDVVSRAMAVEPSRRFDSVEAFEKALTASVTWNRRQLFVGAASAVAGISATTLWWQTRPVLAGSQALAVMRIENRTGDPALAWLDRGLADLLTTNLAQAGGFEVISTDRVRDVLERLKDSAAPIRQAAVEVRADLVVAGEILRMGDALRLNVRLEETASGKVIFAERFEAADTKAVFALADRASEAILARLRVTATAPVNSGEALTSNVEALRLYTEGLDLMERFQVPKAMQALRGAIQADPGFAMAYRMAAHADQWDVASARRDIGHAALLAQQRRLPLREQALIRSGQQTYDGRSDESVTTLQPLLGQYPRDPQIRFELGCALLLLERFDESAAAFEEALRIDPRHRPALGMGAYAYASKGDIDRALAFAYRYQALLKPGDWNGYDIIGDVQAMVERFDDAISAYEKVKRFVKIGITRMHQGRLEEAKAVFESRIKLNLPPVGMGGQLGFLGDAAATQGDFAHAVTRFEEGAHAYGAYYWFGSYLLLKAVYLHFERGSPDRVHELGTRFDHPWSPGLRGAALLALGKDAELEFANLRSNVTAYLGGFMADQHERVYRMLGHLHAGHAERVTALAAGLSPRVYSLASLPLGRAYLAQGKLGEAEKWLRVNRRRQLTYGMIDYYETHNMLAFLLGEYYLGELAARQGKKDEAAKRYKAFLGFMGDSQAPIPQIKAAKTALAA